MKMEELLKKFGDCCYERNKERGTYEAEILRRFADLEAENERLTAEVISWEGSRDGVLQTLDEQEDKVMKAQEKIADLTAYSKKLLDENVALLNERNVANLALAHQQANDLNLLTERDDRIMRLERELEAAHCDWLAKP